MAAVRYTVPVFLLFLLAAAAVLLLLAPLADRAVTQMAAVQVEMPLSHAERQHGAEAITARECTHLPELRMYNPETRRYGHLCMTSAGRIGIVILDEAGREVTAFLRKVNKTWRDTIEYMQRAGYQHIQ